MASACLPLSMVLQIGDIFILDERSEVESRDDVNSSVHRKAQAFLRAIQATLAAVLTGSAQGQGQGKAVSIWAPQHGAPFQKHRPPTTSAPHLQ